MNNNTSSITKNKAQTSMPENPSQSSYVGTIGYWLPLFLYAGTITLVSSLSAPKVHLENFSNLLFSVPVGFFTRIDDKLYHLAEYAILGLLTYRAIRFTWGTRLGSFAGFVTVCAVTVFGLTDEFHQWFTPFRQMEVLDLMADTFGGFLGVMLWELALSLSAIRRLEEQLPLKLQLLRTLTASKF